MKFFSVLYFCTLASVLVAIGSASNDLGYQPKKTYKYDYYFDIQQAKVDSTDPKDRVNIHLKSTVDIYCKWKNDKEVEFSFRFMSVDLDDRQGDQTSEIDPENLKEYRYALLRYEIGFKLDQTTGLASEFSHYDYDYEFAINLKRGLVSVLQKPSEPPASLYSSEQVNTFTTTISDAFGTAQAVVNVAEEGDLRIFTTTRSIEREYVLSTVESRHFVGIQSRVVEKVEVSDNHVMIFGDDSGIAAAGKGVLQLQMKVDGIPEDDTENKVMVKSDLSLTFQDADFKSRNGLSAQMQVYITPTVELIRKYKENPSDGRTFTKIVAALGECREAVDAIKPYLQDPELKTIVVDALTATGDDYAVKTAWDMASTATVLSAQGEEVSDEEAMVRVIIGSSYTNAGTREVLYLNEQAVRSDPSRLPRKVKATAALALGNILFKAGEDRVKRDKGLRNSLWLLEDSLRKSRDVEDQILFLHALGNAGQRSSLPLMITFLVVPDRQPPKEEDVRKAAVFSLLRMKSLADVKVQLKKAIIADENQQIRLTAFEFLLNAKDLTAEDARSILESLVQQQSALVRNFVDILRKSPLYDQLRPFLDSLTKVPTKPPLFRRNSEKIIVGTKSMGASVGYDLILNNVFQSSSSGDQQQVRASAEAFGNIYAISNKIPVFDTFARLQGDLIGKTSPVESFVYFSVGGNVWSHCVDVLGHACSRNKPVGDDRKCVDKTAQLLDLSSTLFKQTISIPLPYGLSIKFGINVAGDLHLSAHAEGCTGPFKGSVTLMPKFGLDVIGDSIIDAILVRAGVTVDAQVLHTEVSAKASLDTSKSPREICLKVHVDQQAVKADFEIWAQVRDKLKFCGKVLCGIQWGHSIGARVDWDGFKRTQFSKDIHQSCSQWKFLNPPRHASIEGDSQQFILQQ